MQTNNYETSHYLPIASLIKRAKERNKRNIKNGITLYRYVKKINRKGGLLMGMNDMIQFFRQMSGKLSSNIYAGVQGQDNPQQISFIRQLQKEMKEKNNLRYPP